MHKDRLRLQPSTPQAQQAGLQPDLVLVLALVLMLLLPTLVLVLVLLVLVLLGGGLAAARRALHPHHCWGCHHQHCLLLALLEARPAPLATAG
jgi:hypothetical protein